MAGDNDVQLMLRFQNEADYAAFEEVFRRHKDALLRFLLRLAGDRAIAEDVSQQTWLKVIDVARRRAFSERPATTLRTWLCSMARNHFIDEHRRKFSATRTVPLPDDLHGCGVTTGHEPPPNPADLVDQRELGRQLAEALQVLPFEQREVIALWAADVDLDSIVAMIGAPRDTVLSRKKYALAKLRKAFSSIRQEECST